MNGLKIRAYYKPLKRMLLPKEIESINFDTKVLGVYLEMDGRGYQKLRMSDFDIMSATGMQDKENNEIYKDDILDGSYINPMSGETLKRHYRVVYEKGVYYARLIGHHPYGTTLLYFVNKESVVIGNVSQNPELLEGME